MRNTIGVLLAGLAGPALAGCGDGPLAVAIGDAFRLEARTESFYDCAPDPDAEPVDSAICGARTDTVALAGYSALGGQFTLTEIRDLTTRGQPGDAPADTLPADQLVIAGQLAEARCDEGCTVTYSGPDTVSVIRHTVVCAGLDARGACQGRTGDTLIVVTLVADTDRPWLLAGRQVDQNRMEGDAEAVAPGPVDPPAPRSRTITRVPWSLIRG
ncbi:MAG TPA: hypothetical protein VFH97_05885 [Gemmatimonadales bacterium]|nr:hypothetical protein [Gemmatimonadales bacterium]